MSVIHILDSKGLCACAKKTPKERMFNFTYSDSHKITCPSCKFYFGKPYFPSA